MKKIVFSVMVIFVLFLAIGLSVPNNKGYAAESSSAEPFKCQHDGDCPSGQKCENGNCVPQGDGGRPMPQPRPKPKP